MKNILIADCRLEKDFLAKLEEESNLKWDMAYRSGTMKTPKYLRVFNFFFFPFIILNKNKDCTNILAWQQFYGIFLSVYNRLIYKREININIMTFIFRPRKGIIGHLWHKFINYALESNNVKKIIVFSKNEIDYYSSIFPKVKNKFIYLPLGIRHISNLIYDEQLRKQKYIFSTGASNRDYNFLISSLKNSQYNVKIACPINCQNYSNIEILQNIYDKRMHHYLYNSYLVVIPLKDLNISSGQLVALQAMQMGKPIIITKSKGITDYLENLKTAIFINNTKTELLEKLSILYTDNELYNYISKNQKETFQLKFSIENLGKNIGQLYK